MFGQAAQVVVIDRCSAHFWTPNDAPAVRVPVGAVVPGSPPRTGVENASPAKLWPQYRSRHRRQKISLQCGPSRGNLSWDFRRSLRDSCFRQCHPWIAGDREDRRFSNDVTSPQLFAAVTRSGPADYSSCIESVDASARGSYAPAHDMQSGVRCSTSPEANES